MGNPKERKECPICGKTLYDRSTWNRHMRIHTGRIIISRLLSRANPQTCYSAAILALYCLHKKSSFFHFLCFQVKNPILVAFVVDVSEQITTNSATRRNVRTDTPELSCNPPRRTAPAWCPAWSTDNVRPLSSPPTLSSPQPPTTSTLPWRVFSSLMFFWKCQSKVLLRITQSVISC